MADADTRAAYFWQGAALCALVFAFSARWGLRGVSRLARNRWAAGVALAALLVAIAGYQFHRAGEKAASNPTVRGQAASALLREERTGPAAEKRSGGTAETQETARTDDWKRSVEAAVKNAEVKVQARQQNGEKAGEEGAAPKQSEFRPENEEAIPLDLGILQMVERQRDETLNAGNATDEASATKDASESKLAMNHSEPPADSSAIGGRQTDSMRSPAGAVSPARNEERALRRIGALSRERGHWRGRHFRWAAYRLVGVARAFPYVWYVTR
jgi:hypothetical protein